MTLIIGVNIPRGMPKRSISSPSPNSLSIKKYYAPNIRNTKWRHYDGGHKNGISQPKLSYFFILFVAHVIRIAFVYSFKGGQVLFFVFSLTFWRKCLPDFSGNDHIRPSLNFFFDPPWIVWLYSKGAPYNISARKSQICVGKKLANAAWSSRSDQLVWNLNVAPALLSVLDYSPDTPCPIIETLQISFWECSPCTPGHCILLEGTVEVEVLLAPSDSAETSSCIGRHDDNFSHKSTRPLRLVLFTILLDLRQYPPQIPIPYMVAIRKKKIPNKNWNKEAARECYECVSLSTASYKAVLYVRAWRVLTGTRTERRASRTRLNATRTWTRGLFGSWRRRLRSSDSSSSKGVAAGWRGAAKRLRACRWLCACFCTIGKAVSVIDTFGMCVGRSTWPPLFPLI